MEKISYKNRLKRLITSERRPDWSKMLNMLAGLFLSVGLGYLLFPQLIYLFIITSILIGLLVNTPFPVKTLSKYAVMMICSGGIAVFTAALATTNLLIAILFFILWLIFFIIMSIRGGLSRTVGLFTMFIYFINLNIVLNNVLDITPGMSILHIIHLAAYCGTIGAFAIFLETAPTLFFKYLQHDPSKSKMLADLYSPNIKYDDFIKNRTIILEADETDRTFTLIEMAMKLMITRFNLEHVTEDINQEKKEYFNKFILEINKLQNQISNAIFHNTDVGMILNLTELRETAKKIDKIESSTPEYLNVKKTINHYLKIFTKLNLALTGAFTEERIPLPKNMEKNEWDSIKDDLTMKNINVRYGIRFAIATNIAFIFDLITGDVLQFAATISSFFTMKPDEKFTKITVIKRIIATLAGSTCATLIAIPLMNLNLSFAIPILAIITMALFYAYMQNNYSIGIFFAMMMVVFIQPTNLLVSQAAYRIFGTAIGAIISFVVGMFILPNSQENNLSILLAKKISLSKDLMVHILTRESKKSLKDQKLIHKNNLVISSSIDCISEEYVNIDNDIDLIIELSSSLNQIKGNFLSLNRYINSTDKDFEFEKAINLFDNFYSKLNNAILEGEVMDFDEEFEELDNEVNDLETDYTNNEDIILLRYFKWIYDDMEMVYDLVKSGEKTQTFSRFNQML